MKNPLAMVLATSLTLGSVSLASMAGCGDDTFCDVCGDDGSDTSTTATGSGCGSTYLCTSTDHKCECHWWPKGSDTPDQTIPPAQCTNASAAQTYPIPGICCKTDQYCNCESRTTPGEQIVCYTGDEVQNCGGTGDKCPK